MIKVKYTLTAAGLLSALAACTPTPPVDTSACTGSEAESSRLFLQQISDNSAIITWRGEADSVCVGTEMDALTTRIDAVTENGSKLARVTDLQADGLYYYSVGGANRAPEGQHFRTAPHTGKSPSDGNIHIWILGDSGSATEFDDDGTSEHPGEAEAVRDGFFTYNRAQAGGEPLDVVLLLGDNAYSVGSEEQWQGAFFEIYPETLKSTPILPTIGNHEMGVGEFDMCLWIKVPGCEKGPVVYPISGGSDSANPNSYDSTGDGPDEGGLPYLSIFTLPARGELGGVPSGTEQYYSANYGNVHVVSLDSQLSNVEEAQRLAMRDWLIDDLSSNEQDWTVVIFHHPPYSKGGNHDSDIEDREIHMRETFAPVFEDHGVDVVYSGHAHNYERSWYLNGHHGMSDTFDPAKHAELNAVGQPAFGFPEMPYTQISHSSGADDKAVYTVAGSAGKVGEEEPCPKGQLIGCTTEEWLMHPAHRSFEKKAHDYRPNGIARLGSVVLDATKTTLTSRFVDHNGEVLDEFVITK